MSPSKQDRQMLDLALKIAELSDCRIKHSAIAVRSGSVLAVGVNKFRNDPAWVSDSCTGRSRIYSRHAEIACLSKIQNTKGVKLYIARLRPNGDPGLSKPCKFCYEEIYRRGVSKICYTVEA